MENTFIRTVVKTTGKRSNLQRKINPEAVQCQSIQKNKSSKKPFKNKQFKKFQMSNRYTSSNVSIIPGEGCMYNQATTYVNDHFMKPYVNNDSTNMIVGYVIPKKYVYKKPSKKLKKK